MTLPDKLFKFARRSHWSLDRLVIELAAFIEDRGLSEQLQIDLDADVETDDRGFAQIQAEIAADAAHPVIEETVLGVMGVPKGLIRSPDEYTLGELLDLYEELAEEPVEEEPVEGEPVEEEPVEEEPVEDDADD